MREMETTVLCCANQLIVDLNQLILQQLLSFSGSILYITLETA